MRIDGVDVRSVKLKSLRREVGVLMQDPFIFKGTVMENIRYGRPDATDEECIAAAKQIFADSCIERLPNGYFEELAERGEGLSAGEKQLISFARIVVKNPSVVVLDEFHFFGYGDTHSARIGGAFEGAHQFYRRAQAFHHTQFRPYFVYFQ